MRTEIKRLHQRLGTTIVYVMHDQIEAMTLATRIAVMKDGNVQQFGPPQEVYGFGAYGLRILIVEKGERLLPCPEARDDMATFQRGHFAPKEQSLGSDGTPFVAGN